MTEEPEVGVILKNLRNLKQVKKQKYIRKIKRYIWKGVKAKVVDNCVKIKVKNIII